jgi:SAM-dependent methyltransferase
VLGPVLNNSGFSGRWNPPGQGSSLVLCEGCRFQFKDPPTIPPENLEDYYATVTRAEWGNIAWRGLGVLPALAAQHAEGRRILDVGCAAGEVLLEFPQQWQKFGIEPSLQTSAAARQRGINILAPSLDQLPAGTSPFDVVMAIDVAEHVVDPVPFFRQLRGVLRPGAVAIIVTGDTDAWQWRLEKGLYWYVALPEHASFYCRDSLAEIERQTGFEAVEHCRRSHGTYPLNKRLSQLTRNLAYVALRKTGGLGIPKLRNRVLGNGAPEWSSASDHMIHIMRAV